jgi:hypothetical protein
VPGAWWWFPFIDVELHSAKRLYYTKEEKEVDGLSGSYVVEDTITLGMPTKAHLKRIAEIEKEVLEQGPHFTKEIVDGVLKRSLYLFLSQDKNWHGVNNPWALFFSQHELWRAKVEQHFYEPEFALDEQHGFYGIGHRPEV